MAHKVIIECEARFNDHLSDEAKSAADSVEDIGEAAEKTKKKVDGLGKKKIRPIFDADNNKFLKKIREAEARAEKLGRTKTKMTLEAVDKATTVIGKILNKGQSFGRSVWSAVLKVKDSQAMQTISKVTSAAKTLAGKTWHAIVKIKDYATTPLTKIKNALFSIKSLVAAVTAGIAAKQFILNPINLADSYASAKIGFSTLLGESKGNQMMDDLDAFAKATPFQTSQVIAQSQRMLAMGWNAEDIIKDMETIGDAAAATGKGEEGLQRIVLALSQIKSKGKLSTEELNQLAEGGIAAKRYLAEGLGYGTGDEGLAKMTKDLENGKIMADTAVQTILNGMKEYKGMMSKTANETVTGIWSQIQDTFEINIFRKWGQGLQDGAKRGLGAILKLLDNADEALAKLGDTVYAVGKEISNWAADKLENAVKTIQEVTGSLEFKDASLGGKVKILWDEVIAKPFSEWWNTSGKKKVAEIAGSLGSTLGKGITGGLLALLGIDAEGALADGVSIGGSFMEGFLEGFDTEKIGEALKTWVTNNKGLATVLGGILAWKIITGLASGIGSIKTLFGGSGGSGGGLASAYSTATMTVTADVVNVFGNSGFSSGSKGFTGTGGSGGGTLLLPGTGGLKNLLPGGTGGQLALPSGSGGQLLLPGGTGTGASVIGAGAKTLTGVTLKNGTIAATGSGLTAGLAKVGVALGSGATTAGGAAAAGAAGTGGILGLITGGISAGVDIFQGVKKGKAGDKKGAKDEYVTAGTKGGMMLTGAGIGAAIGSVIPGAGTAIGALVGGGIGGIVGTFTGDKAGKAISDSTDEGGWLSNAWKSTKGFFKETIGPFFTKTIPDAWDSLWDSVGAFFTETIPQAWDILKGKVSTFFTETIPDAWDSMWDAVGTFFTETVPYAIGYAVGKINIFFTETIPDAWNSFWDAVGAFFTETIPGWADTIWNDYTVPFFTETIPDVWDSFWGAVGAFFTETIPGWADTIWNDYTVPFFTETIPSVWNSFWGAIGTFFTETIPGWADTIWNEHIVPFFTETLPAAWDTMWGAIKTFFTEAIPQWASTVWNNKIVPFFTESIPEFFSNLWTSIKTFFTESLPTFASTIWGGIKGFFTDIIPGWVKSTIDSVKSSFSAGKSDAESGSGFSPRKARGGIVGGSSSMEAFARGGIVGGSTRWIRVNEESPEMIIPLSSQRRKRALSLWSKTGNLLGVPGFARGGITTGDQQDEGIRFQSTASEPTNMRSVVVEVGGIHIELKVDGTNPEKVVQAIKEQIEDIADAVAGIFADEFGSIFENTPVRGVVN